MVYRFAAPRLGRLDADRARREALVDVVSAHSSFTPTFLLAPAHLLALRTEAFFLVEGHRPSR